jgi:hypothetical protein
MHHLLQVGRGSDMTKAARNGCLLNVDGPLRVDGALRINAPLE